MSILVKKADGNLEAFKPEKLKQSLAKAGASKEEIASITDRIVAVIHDGITTQEIYRHAFSLLHREESGPVAARYSLRRALFGLGPTGFPFEDFLARMFQAQGYTTKTGIMIQGTCARHEIDIAAYNANHSFIGEAKFHARPGLKSDLQVAMYSYARLLDLQHNKICSADVCGIQEFILITNTKFTTSAQSYGKCVGLKLLSWDYPTKGNLHDLIEDLHIYPITVLATLSRSQKLALLNANVLLCNDILNKSHILRTLHLSQRKIDAVLSEVRQLCQK